MSEELDKVTRAHNEGEIFEASKTCDPFKRLGEAIDKHVRYSTEELEGYEKGRDNVRKQQG